MKGEVKKILLVEDEMGVVDFITKGLTEANYEVTAVFDGNSAIEMASRVNFDLFILDIMLPHKNGLEVCRELRAKNIQAPVLFLTALGTSENIAMGLNTGADDYLVKPFKFIELHARINALLRRASMRDEVSSSKANLLVVEDLTVNDDAKTVERNGVAISLTATEYRLLIALLRNRGKVMSRAELLESAWSINFDMGTNVVDVYINYLRKKIDSEATHKLIQTVVGMGYVIK